MTSTGTSAGAVTLVITGPEGQKFSGRYIADSKTNGLNAMVPATITVQAKDFSYRFQPEDSREGFRVALVIDEMPRTSFVSYQGAPVQGVAALEL